MKIPLVSLIVNGIVKAIKALNCKCRSTCCDSECSQKQARSSDVEVKIHDYSEKIGEIKQVAEL